MSEKNRKRPLLGTCLCKAVCYQVTDAFIFAANCHCAACRRTTGSAFKAFARIHGEELTVIRDEGDISSFQKDQFTDEHCKRCSSLLFSRVDGGFVHVAMGTLVDAPSISPTDHMFVGSKAPWFTITDALPQHEGHVTRKEAD
jgi:hypothetical protein